MDEIKDKAVRDEKREEIDRKIAKAHKIFALSDWLAETIAVLLAVALLINVIRVSPNFGEGLLSFVVGLVGIAVTYLVMKVGISFAQLHIAYKEDVSHSLRKDKDQ